MAVKETDAIDDGVQEGIVDPETENEELFPDQYEDEEVEIDAQDVDEVEIVDSEKQKKDEKKAEKPAQTPEENAKFAAARRKAEEKQREAQEKLNEVLKLFGANSYEEALSLEIELTKEERDKVVRTAQSKDEDEEEALERAEDKKRTRIIAFRDKVRTAKENADKVNKEKATADIEEFKAAFPNADPNEVMKDPDFMDYADGKLGRLSFAEIYKKYLNFTGKTEVERAARAAVRSERATSTGKSGEKVAMTAAEYQALQSWNEANPDYKMTPKEFINRRS